MYYTSESLQVKRACNNDETRPYRQSVLLDNGVAIATNGHLLFRVGATAEYQDKDDVPKIININPQKCSATISEGSADQLLKMIPRKSVLPVLQGFWLGKNGSNDLQAASTNLDSSVVVRTEEPEFPNINKLWPDGKPVFEVAFSAKLLKQLAEFVVRANPDNPAETIKLKFYGDTKYPETCAYFDAGVNHRGQKVDGLIMPLRMVE